MTKISKEFEEAARQPDSRAHTIEVTPELKQRLSKISAELIDWLQEHTKGPIEAYMLLHFTMETLQEAAGIRASVIVEDGDADGGN
jgi:hypothetical protein